MRKMFLARQKAAGRLAGMLRHDGPLIAQLLEPRMRRVLAEGEEMPDVAHLLDVLGRVVRAECQDLDEADHVRMREGGAVAYARHRLINEAFPRLRAKIVEVRKHMVQAFGRKATSQVLRLGKKRTPRALFEVEELAEHMVNVLPVLNQPTVAGQKIRPAAWAKYLTPDLDEVRDLSTALLDHLDDESDGVNLKKKAMAGFDKTFRKVLKLGEGFYHLAGLERMAKHLRVEAGRPADQKTGGGKGNVNIA